MNMISVTMNLKRLFLLLLPVVPFLVFAQHQPTDMNSMQELKWEKVAPGIWKAGIGKKELAPLDFASPPKIEALKTLGDADFPFRGKITRADSHRNRFSARLPLEENEKIYGMGLEFEGVNRRRNVFHLKVDHYGGVKGYTHAPVPFYISSGGLGSSLPDGMFFPNDDAECMVFGEETMELPGGQH